LLYFFSFDSIQTTKVWKSTNETKEYDMNFFTKLCLATKLLTVACAFTVFAAHGQQGMLEFHGVITSPGCTVNVQYAAQLSSKAYLTGKACGLTSDTRNQLSQMNIAQIKEETWFNTSGVDSNKRLVTFSYH
jgi:hypothetical protein